MQLTPIELYFRNVGLNAGWHLPVSRLQPTPLNPQCSEPFFNPEIHEFLTSSAHPPMKTRLPGEILT
jgi:hypothetical protein